MSFASILRTTPSPFAAPPVRARTPSVGFKAEMASTSTAVGSDTASISNEGARLAAESSAGPSQRSALSIALHDSADPASAGPLVEAVANNAEGFLVSLPPAPGDPEYYWRTGELVTDQNKAAFDARAQQVLVGKQAIYNAEMAKGTPPADIYDKLADYMQSLPTDDFKRHMSGWGDLTGTDIRHS